MALETSLRKAGSQNFDTIRPMNGYEKSESFMALAQTIFGTGKKTNRWGPIPPPSNRVKKLHKANHLLIMYKCFA